MSVAIMAKMAWIITTPTDAYPNCLWRFANTLLDRFDTHRNVEVPARFAQELRECLGQDAPPLSLTESHVIMCIGEEGGTTAIRIADALNMTRGGVSKIVARLEAKGFLEEKDNPEVRGILLGLTPLGEKAFDVHDKMHQQNYQHWLDLFASWSPEDRETAVRLISSVLKNE